MGWKGIVSIEIVYYKQKRLDRPSKVHIFLISIVSRVEYCHDGLSVYLPVCMNTSISGFIKSGTIKFGVNITFYCLQIHIILEFGDAFYRPRKIGKALSQV